ncbi:hypothetical protein PG984_011853 [Apiospora sp. TS-2023a]
MATTPITTPVMTMMKFPATPSVPMQTTVAPSTLVEPTSAVTIMVSLLGALTSNGDRLRKRGCYRGSASGLRTCRRAHNTQNALPCGIQWAVSWFLLDLLGHYRGSICAAAVQAGGLGPGLAAPLVPSQQEDPRLRQRPAPREPAVIMAAEDDANPKASKEHTGAREEGILPTSRANPVTAPAGRHRWGLHGRGLYRGQDRGRRDGQVHIRHHHRLN